MLCRDQLRPPATREGLGGGCGPEDVTRGVHGLWCNTVVIFLGHSVCVSGCLLKRNSFVFRYFLKRVMLQAQVIPKSLSNLLECLVKNLKVTRHRAVIGGWDCPLD